MKPKFYVPAVLRNFQGFTVNDIKEWVSEERVEVHLEQDSKALRECHKCGCELGNYHDQYRINAKHLKMMGWQNEALNEDRKEELDRIDPEGEMGDLMNGKYRHKFLTKAGNRSKKDTRHIEEVCRLNKKMAALEIIKERLHNFFKSENVDEAELVLAEAYEWAFDAKAWNIWKWVQSIRKQSTLYNYFKYRVTTGLSEGLNRVIKGLKVDSSAQPFFLRVSSNFIIYIFQIFNTLM